MPAKYNKYLQSDKWKNIKETVIERDNHQCQECGREEGLLVHHKTYDNIFHEEEHLDDLITLCDSCHYKKHFPTEGQLVYEHPFWGTMVRMKQDRRKFKMVYTVDGTVKFSSDTFYKYWYIITNNLHFNCNVVILKKPKIHPLRTVSEFCKLCDAGQATMYKFIKECKQKHYMGKFKMDDIYWVVNPRYARTGGDVPLRLLDLFKFGEDYLNDNPKIEKELMEEE